MPGVRAGVLPGGAGTVTECLACRYCYWVPGVRVGVLPGGAGTVTGCLACRYCYWVPGVRAGVRPGGVGQVLLLGAGGMRTEWRGPCLSAPAGLGG